MRIVKRWVIYWKYYAVAEHGSVSKLRLGKRRDNWGVSVFHGWRKQTEIMSINSKSTDEGLYSFGMISTLKVKNTTSHTSLTLNWRHIGFFKKEIFLQNLVFWGWLFKKNEFPEVTKIKSFEVSNCVSFIYLKIDL